MITCSQRLWSRMSEGMHCGSQQIQSQPWCPTFGVRPEAGRWRSSADWQGSFQAFWLGRIKKQRGCICLGFSLPNVHCCNKKLARRRTLLWLPDWIAKETITSKIHRRTCCCHMYSVFLLLPVVVVVVVAFVNCKSVTLQHAAVAKQ